MKDKTQVFNIGKERVVVAGLGSGMQSPMQSPVFYRVKEICPQFEFSFKEIAKILIQLPFAYSVVPLNYGSGSSERFRSYDPNKYLVEVYPVSRAALEIYPPNFRKIEQICIVDGVLGTNPLVQKLNPDHIMDDPDFRCCFHPKRKTFGIPDHKEDLGSGTPYISDTFLIEIYKFSKQDARRIRDYIKTLDDCSEEAGVNRDLEELLRSIK